MRERKGESKRGKMKKKSKIGRFYLKHGCRRRNEIFFFFSFTAEEQALLGKLFYISN